MLLVMSSCSDKKSYAKLLNEENKSVNSFLADQIVCTSIPSDTVFEVGPNAPYYALDEEGNVYMQVLNTGTPGQKVVSDQMVFFRFTRWNLETYAQTGELGDGFGNANDMSIGQASFRYGNYTLSSSSQWGSGLQMPLAYLNIDCEVNLIIKSQYGITSELANVIPFLYNVRYYSAVSN